MKNSILEAIGNTPLVKINRTLPGITSVYGKCEFMNPTGSIKDRMALHIIERAEQEGLLKPGGTIVENTAGNTGLGLAMVAAIKGYKCIFTMPDKMSEEKRAMLRAFGAEVVVTPNSALPDDPQHYVQVAMKISKDTPNSYHVNQYQNLFNTEAHYLHTGKEIWEQTEGKITHFVAGAGTGGTVSGVGKYLKEQNPEIKIIAVDPIGSVHHERFFKKEELNPGSYLVEGIGEDIICEALDLSVIDDFRVVNDRDCFITARNLLRKDGIFCGGSAGASVKIAGDIARELDNKCLVVSILCDSATRYTSKYLSDKWLEEKGFADII